MLQKRCGLICIEREELIIPRSDACCAQRRHEPCLDWKRRELSCHGLHVFDQTVGHAPGKSPGIGTCQY